MRIETERRFIVRHLPAMNRCTDIIQVYREYETSGRYIVIDSVEIEPDEIPDVKYVRLRVESGKGFVTFKKGKGLHREEYETEINMDIIAPIVYNDPYAITKTRCMAIDMPGIVIDRFSGIYEGIVIAEWETDVISSMPDWLGREITDEYRLSNLSMYLSSCDNIIKLYRSLT